MVHLLFRAVGADIRKLRSVSHDTAPPYEDELFAEIMIIKNISGQHLSLIFSSPPRLRHRPPVGIDGERIELDGLAAVGQEKGAFRKVHLRDCQAILRAEFHWQSGGLRMPAPPSMLSMAK